MKTSSGHDKAHGRASHYVLRVPPASSHHHGWRQVETQAEETRTALPVAADAPERLSDLVLEKVLKQSANIYIVVCCSASFS